jgi:hypothetical protein
MADPGGIHFRGAFGGELHQVDAAAWRVHLLAPEDVGRADGETETAVHALVDDFGGRRVVSVER